jgi:hypothetical protein
MSSESSFANIFLFHPNMMETRSWSNLEKNLETKELI